MGNTDATDYYACVRQAIWERLVGYDPATLARWWAWLNSWAWPEDCPVPQPVGWETTQLFVKKNQTTIPRDTPNRAVLMAPLWDVLVNLTSEDDRNNAPRPEREMPEGSVRLTNSGRLLVEEHFPHG